MRVLVTGSSGFIGKAVTKALQLQGDTVTPFDHPSTICDLSELEAACYGIDGIINLAGALGTTEIFGNEYNAANVNILGAINVLDAAAQYGIPVVQIGTGHKGQPNPYAITKAAAEEMALARAHYCKQRINVVRAYHVYGPGQKATPPYGKGTVRKIMPSFICAALADRHIEVYGSGEQTIDLVYVDDVAEVLVKALSEPYGQLIEAGTGKPTTVLDAAKTVIAATDSTSRIKHLPMRQGEPEGATVVASAPACTHAWPYKLDETIAYYR